MGGIPKKRTLIKLSICISTRNRADYLPETLLSILSQCTDEVEVVVLDGASTDDTVAVVSRLATRYPNLRCVESTENGGIDVDFDRCVVAARGRHCWLFSDDDLFVPGAIARVLLALADDPTVLLVDAAVHGPDLVRCYERKRLGFTGERVYREGDGATFLRDCAQHISFIGVVIVRRDFWLSRDRASYFGSFFVHVGVIFQAPVPGHVRVLGAPLVVSRFGLASWNARAFEIWMYKWPDLIWSFDWLPESARAHVTPRRPWQLARRMLLMRAFGAFGPAEYAKLLDARHPSGPQRVVPWIAARTPGALAYGLARTALLIRNPNEMMHVVLDASPYRWGPKW